MYSLPLTGSYFILAVYFDNWFGGINEAAQTHLREKFLRIFICHSQLKAKWQDLDKVS